MLFYVLVSPHVLSVLRRKDIVIFYCWNTVLFGVLLEDVRFEVFTVVKIRNLVFWVMKSCRLVCGYKRSSKSFVTTYMVRIPDHSTVCVNIIIGLYHFTFLLLVMEKF